MKYGYGREAITQALRSLGLKEGDNIFVHSNLGYFGRLSGAETAEDYFSAFAESIFAVIGHSGTLSVPTFSYSFCNGQPFEKAKTPGVCGLFSELVRTDSRALRSGDANFSVAAIGPLAGFLTENAPAYSFGEDSFWARFLQRNGRVVNFNFDAGSTFLHYVERCLKVPYRYDKAFSGISVEGTKEIPKTFYHFVYDLNKPEHGPDFTKFHREAVGAGLVKKAELGRGQMLTISARDVFDFVEAGLRDDPYLLTRGNSRT